MNSSDTRIGRVPQGSRRVVAAVVELLLPPFPALEAQVRVAVVGEATRFAIAQIENIPTFLRLPYLLAITGFQWLAVLRFGRPFLRLPRPRQDAYLALWSDSPIAPMRDFVRLIRGCVVLAYFDHPEVIRSLRAERDADAGGDAETRRVAAR
jgi:hypothetical protein